MNRFIKTSLVGMMLFTSICFRSHADSLKAWVEKVKLPTPEIETLPNGLTLAWFIDQRLPIVDLAMLVRSGYTNDPKGKSGSAHMLSSLLDRGAGGLNFSQISKGVEQLGASKYVRLDDESFTIGMHGLSDDALTLLGLLSKIILDPTLPKDEFKKEKKRTIEAWDHIGDTSGSLASLAFSRWIHSGTRYGRGSFKSSRSLKSLKRKDVVDYYKSFFKPDRSVLMVVGNVKKETFRKDILKAFGGWKGKSKKNTWVQFTHPKFKSSKKTKGIIVDRKGLSQAKLFMGFDAPKYTHPDHYALVVANALFGEYFHSRLNTKIRDQMALTYSIGSTFSYKKEHGVFLVSSSTRNEQIGKLVKEIEGLTKKWIQGPISKKEVEEAKTYLLGQFPVRTGTLHSVASRWLGGFIFGLGPNYLNEFIPRVSHISVNDVQSALRRHFKNKRYKVVIAGNSKEIKKSLRKEKISGYRVLTQKDLM